MSVLVKLIGVNNEAVYLELSTALELLRFEPGTFQSQAKCANRFTTMLGYKFNLYCCEIRCVKYHNRTRIIILGKIKLCLGRFILGM